MSAPSIRFVWRRCARFMASTILLMAGLLGLTSTAFAITPVASALSETVPVLDPTESYGFVWAPMDLEDYPVLETMIHDLKDINTIFDLMDEGWIVIKVIAQFDQENQATIPLYSDVLLEVDSHGSGPGLSGSPYCGTKNPTDIGITSGVDRDSYAFYGGEWWDLENQLWEVRYFPNCRSYPCNRTSKGEAGYAMFVPDPPHDVPMYAYTLTDFYWKSGHNGVLNYWTTQDAWGWDKWTVGLWSGDSNIGYVHYSCAWDTNGLVLNWW